VTQRELLLGEIIEEGGGGKQTSPAQIKTSSGERGKPPKMRKKKGERVRTQLKGKKKPSSPHAISQPSYFRH